MIPCLLPHTLRSLNLAPVEEIHEVQRQLSHHPVFALCLPLHKDKKQTNNCE